MSNLHCHLTGRREFVAGALRWTALAGLAGMSAYLVRPSAAEADGQCPESVPCRQCPSRSTCRLPQAASSEAER